MTPQPIDRCRCRLGRCACNGSRPRRYSTDPARRRFYAQHRAARFVRRFQP